VIKAAALDQEGRECGWVGDRVTLTDDGGEAAQKLGVKARLFEHVTILARFQAIAIASGVWRQFAFRNEI
jgi:hypothetical protein